METRAINLPVLVALIKHLKPRLTQLECHADTARRRVHRMEQMFSGESISLRAEIEAYELVKAEFVELSDALIQAEALVAPPTLEQALAHCRALLPEPEPALTVELRRLLAETERTAAQLPAAVAEGMLAPDTGLSLQGRRS